MRKEKFYTKLCVNRALVASAPFWLAAAASQQVSAQLTATDVASLRAHITTANGSTVDETINVNAGTYMLTGGPDGGTPNVSSGDLDITKSAGNLTIVGAGTATTIIDAASLDRVLHIAATTGGAITIRNLTIRNGRAVDDGSGGAFPPEAKGGGIFNESGTNLTLENVALENNSASGFDGITTGNVGGAALGGGVYSEGGTLTISACTFDSNTSAGGDGFDGTFSTPAAPGGIAHGAGLFVAAGTVSITNTTFTGGICTGGAGGSGYFGFNGGGGGNGGDARGGAIYFAAGGLTIMGSTIDGNGVNGGQARPGRPGQDGFFSGGMGGLGGSGGNAEGGALYGGGTLILRNSTVSGNGALGGAGGDGGDGGDASSPTSGIGASGGSGGDAGSGTGGGLFTAAGALTLENCTVAANSAAVGAAGQGGLAGIGIFGSGSAGTAGLAGTEVGGNVATQGGTVSLASTIVADGSAAAGPDVSGAATATASLVEDDSGATIASGYITGDPGLAALADNGGLTRTHAILSTSIAFNAGANPAALTTDQRGTGFARVRDGTADIGAFEVQTGSGGGGGNGGGSSSGGGGGGGGGGCAGDVRAGWFAPALAILAAFAARRRRRWT